MFLKKKKKKAVSVLSVLFKDRYQYLSLRCAG